MGSFSVRCLFTNVQIDHYDHCVAIPICADKFSRDTFSDMITRVGDYWRPAGLPLYGKYNDYGSIDSDMSNITKSNEVFNKKLFDTDELEFRRKWLVNIDYSTIKLIDEPEYNSEEHAKLLENHCDITWAFIHKDVWDEKMKGVDEVLKNFTKSIDKFVKNYTPGKHHEEFPGMIKDNYLMSLDDDTETRLFYWMFEEQQRYYTFLKMEIFEIFGKFVLDVYKNIKTIDQMPNELIEFIKIQQMHDALGGIGKFWFATSVLGEQFPSSESMDYEIRMNMLAIKIMLDKIQRNKEFEE